MFWRSKNLKKCPLLLVTPNLPKIKNNYLLSQIITNYRIKAYIINFQKISKTESDCRLQSVASDFFRKTIEILTDK